MATLDYPNSDLSGILRINSVNIIQTMETSNQNNQSIDSNISNSPYNYWYLTNQLGNHYCKYKQYDKAVTHHQINLDFARSILNNKSAEAESTQNLGICFKLRSMYDGAISLFERLLLIGGQLDNSAFKNVALYHLIDTYIKKANHLKSINAIEFKIHIGNAISKAREYYIERMSLIGTNDTKTIRKEGLQQLYSRLGHFQIDSSTYLNILEESQKLGSFSVELQSTLSLIDFCLSSDRENEANIYYRNLLRLCNNIGNTTLSINLYKSYHNLLNLANVMGSFYFNLFITEKIDDKIGESIAYECLSDLYYMIGYNRYALEYAELHYNLCDEINDRNEKIHSKANIDKIKRQIKRDNNKQPDSNSDQSITSKRMEKTLVFELWKVNNNSGLQFYDAKEYDKAATIHKENIKIAKGQLNDPDFEIESLQKLALCYKAMDNYDESLTTFKIILKRSREMRHEFFENISLIQLENICNKMGKHEDALKYREEKLIRVSRYCDKIQPYETFEEVYHKLTCFNGASSILKKSLNRAEKLQCKVLELQGLMNLGDCLFAVGETIEALQYYNKILKITYDLSSGNVTSPIFYNYYHINCGLRKLINLLGLLHLNLLITKRINDKPGQCVTYKFMCDIYMKLGNNQRALVYAKEYGKLCKQIKYFYGMIKSKNMVTELLSSNSEKMNRSETRCTEVNDISGIMITDIIPSLSSSDSNNLQWTWTRQNTLANEYYHTNKFNQAEELFIANLILSREQLNDKTYEIKTLNNLAILYCSSDAKYNESIEILEDLLQLADKMKDSNTIESTLYRLGCSYLLRANKNPYMNLSLVRDDLNKAASYFQSSLKIDGYQNQPDFALGLLGKIHYKLEDYSIALNYYQRELDIIKEKCDDQRQIQIYSDIADCYKYLNNYSESLGNLEKALKLSVKIKDRTMELNICFNLQNTYQFFNRFNQMGIDYNKRCIRIASSLKDTASEAIGYWNISYIHYRRSELKSAYNYAKLHHQTALAIGDHAMVAASQTNMLSLKKEMELQKPTCHKDASDENTNSADKNQ